MVGHSGNTEQAVDRQWSDLSKREQYFNDVVRFWKVFRSDKTKERHTVTQSFANSSYLPTKPIFTWLFNSSENICLTLLALLVIIKYEFLPSFPTDLGCIFRSFGWAVTSDEQVRSPPSPASAPRRWAASAGEGTTWLCWRRHGSSTPASCMASRLCQHTPAASPQTSSAKRWSTWRWTSTGGWRRFWSARCSVLTMWPLCLCGLSRWETVGLRLSQCH